MSESDLLNNPDPTDVSVRRLSSTVTVTRSVMLAELEPRILLDAVAIDSSRPSVSGYVVQEMEHLTHVLDQVMDDTSWTFPELASQSPIPLWQDFTDEVSTTSPVDGRLELVFIDGSLENAEQLLSGWSIAPDGVTRVVFRISTNGDGLDQIRLATQNLSQPIDALHIISHGTAGGLQLGSTWLDTTEVMARQADLQALRGALSPDADILFYGCSLAANEAGQGMLDLIGTYTGADIAASVDVTGHNSLGGNWTLEYHIGLIETSIVVSAEAQAEWWNTLDLTAVGAETRVNTTTTGTQGTTNYGGGNIAADANGNYVVVWQDNRSGNFDIWAQLYNSNGDAQGSEFRVNTHLPNDQIEASVAMDANGNFVVTWSSSLQDGSSYGVYAQRFSASGAAQGSEFRVNTATTGDQSLSRVAMDASGNFVVTWTNYNTNSGDIWAQRYDSSGVAQGSNFQVNTYTSNIQAYSDIAMNASGDFVVVWESTNQDGSGLGVYGQRYNAAGVAQGGEFRVNVTTTNHQESGKVGMADDGSFVISWSCSQADGNGYATVFRRYDSSGNALTGEIIANTYTQGDQSFGDVAVHANGAFIITWGSASQDGSGRGIYAQQYDSTGSPIGGEIRVNTTTINEQYNPSIIYHNSQAVVVWRGNGPGDPDGVFFQRFSTTDFSTITVTTNWDTVDGDTSSIAALLSNRGPDGNISLREAIMAANNSGLGSGVAHQIHFAINTGGQTITVTGGDLPAISTALVIDGSTQPGYSGSPLISLVADAGRQYGLRLWPGSDGSTIRALNIQGFSVSGIDISGSHGNSIVGNYLGTNAAGNAAAGNALGINIWGGTNNTIGGTTAADRNVISGNTNLGIYLGNSSNNNVILGNYVGLNAAGNMAIANASVGIYVADSNSVSIGDGTGSGRNIISGNGVDGIILDNTVNASIRGNFIGLTASGASVLGNGQNGIFLTNGTTGATIGGTAAGTGNTIGGNAGAGIALSGNLTTGNTILGNFIGTDQTGTLNLGNGGDGILVTTGASNNMLGGTDSNAGNIIAFNGRDGIRIENSAGNGNAILGNRIFANSGLGINLVGGSEDAYGVTLNDLGDGDAGPNSLQNFPVIASATIDGNNMTVTGTLDSIASRTFRIEVFANATPDDSGHGEGQRYLGAFNATTDGSGHVAFDETLLGVNVAEGEFITFTATDLTLNNTSEFSYAVMASLLGNVAPFALQVTRTRQGGLELNHGAGNNAYLVADNGGAILGGLTALTIEMQFSLAQANVQHTFLSYAVTGNDNEVYINTLANGALRFFIKGASITTNAINFNDLVGTGQHTLSVSWSNIAGAWHIYLNGVQIASGSGLQTGAFLSSGGSLVFGHDQDSVGGGFQASQAFKGTFYDARIFNTVRTAQQIFAHHATTVPYFEPNLLANWTFNDLSTGDVVTDVVAGNNLTLQTINDPGFTAGSSSLYLSVQENAAPGTVVGSIFGVDWERESKIAQLLAEDPNLRYSAEFNKFYKLVDATLTWPNAQAVAIATQLNSISGQLLTIQNGAENAFAVLMRNQLGSDIWLGYSDQLVEGEWRVYYGSDPGDQFWHGSMTGYRVHGIYSNWATNEPNDSGGNEDYVELRSTGRWNDANNSATRRFVIEWNADDVLDTTNALTYSITSQTVSGAFAIDPSTGLVTVADGSVLDYETHTAHTITVRVTDSDGSWYEQEFTIQLQNVAVEASVYVPGPQSLDAGTSIAFSSANGNAIVVTDQNASTNSYLQLHLGVASGTLTLSSLAGLEIIHGANNSSYMVINGTESDINAALDGLLFVPADGFSGTVQLDVSVMHANGLAGWYEFAGNANDTSIGIADHGTFFGDAATVLDPLLGEVLSLDGNGDYVRVDGMFGNPTHVTLAAWVNLNTPGFSGAEVISLGDNVALRLDGSGGLNGFYRQSGGWSNTTTSINLAGTGWHHVAYTIDTSANIQRIYLDGILVAETHHSESIVYDQGNHTYIGRHGNGGGSFFFNGLIDDARIYTRALTGDEVAALASGNLGQSNFVTITVNPHNDAPQFINLGGTVSFTEGGSPVVLDHDVQVFDVQLSGADNFNGASLTIARNGGAHTDDVFWATGTMSFSGGNLIVGTTMIGSVTNTDGTLVITFNANATNALVNEALQQIAYSNASYNPPASVQLVWTINDGNDGDQGPGGAMTATGSVTVEITAVNNEQVLAVNQGITLAENSTGSIITQEMLETTDLDHAPQELVYSITSNVVHGTLRRNGVALGVNDWFTQQDINDGMITYDHDGSENHVDSFSFSVDDGEGLASTGTFIITITPVNDHTPVITSDGGGAVATVNVAENTTYVTTVIATDADMPGDTLTFSISGGADAGYFAIDSITGELSFIGAPDFENPTDADLDGEYEVTVAVFDGIHTTTQTIYVTVTDANEFAVGTISDTNPAADYVLENSAIATTVGIVAWADDPDGTDTVSYSLDDDAGGLFAIDAITGVVTVAGAIDRETVGATLDIVVRATSTDGSFSTATFTIDIVDVNEFDVGPISDTNGAANVVVENASIGTAVGITAFAQDLDATNQQITYTLDDSAGGRFEIDTNTGVVTVAGVLDYHTAMSHQITVRATSQDGSFSTASFVIDVTNSNTPPQGFPDFYQVQQGNVLGAPFSVLHNDIDPQGDPLTAHVVVWPSFGSLLWNTDGHFMYVPALHFSGEDSFAYQPMDSELFGNITWVTITVTPIGGVSHNTTATQAHDEIMLGALAGVLANLDESRESNDQTIGSVLVVNHGLTENESPFDRPQPVVPQRMSVMQDDPESGFGLRAKLAIDNRLEVKLDQGMNNMMNRIGRPSVALGGDYEGQRFWGLQAGDIDYALAQLRRDVDADMKWDWVMKSPVLATSVGLAAGYLLWTLRGAFLTVTLASSMPTWRFIDPLPVMDQALDSPKEREFEGESQIATIWKHA